MKKSIYLIISLVLVLIGFFILSPESVNYCINCFDNFLTFDIGQPLFFAFIPFVLLFFVSLFIKESKLKLNYNIFNIYLVVFIVLISILPRSCNVFTPLCPSKTITTMLVSSVLVIYAFVMMYKNRNAGV